MDHHHRVLEAGALIRYLHLGQDIDRLHFPAGSNYTLVIGEDHVINILLEIEITWQTAILILTKFINDNPGINHLAVMVHNAIAATANTDLILPFTEMPAIKNIEFLSEDEHATNDNRLIVMKNCVIEGLYQYKTMFTCSLEEFAITPNSKILTSTNDNVMDYIRPFNACFQRMIRQGIYKLKAAIDMLPEYFDEVLPLEIIEMIAEYLIGTDLDRSWIPNKLHRKLFEQIETADELEDLKLKIRHFVRLTAKLKQQARKTF